MGFFELIVGIIGGIFGLVVGILGGIFGLFVGLLGSLFGLAVTGVVLLLIGAPVLLLLALIF